MTGTRTAVQPNDSVRAARAGAKEMPGGDKRARAFPGEIRAKLIKKDGKDFYRVEGYASVFERGYEMWDYFGPYTEIVDAAALDQSLKSSPDVAFLVNHHGVTMARTTNDTLKLSADSTGLAADALLNAERQDVRDLASAIDDGLIDEMSFAFQLKQGQWSPDYDEYRITQADIHRGDVSAVNYGANPYTSIAARASDWLADAAKMPAAVALAGLTRLRERADLARAMGGGMGGGSADTDADENANAMIASLDAILDQASMLTAGVDRASVPEGVAQALDLITGAESVVDDLMGLLGILDPDDAADRSSRVAQIRQRVTPPPVKPGAPVALVAMRLIAA